MYIFWGVIPAIILIIIIMLTDLKEKEPIHVILRTIFLSLLAIVGSLLLESIFSFTSEWGRESIIFFLFLDLLVVGFVEEICKFITLRLATFKNKYFNNPYDGIVYSAYVALGFAAVENLFYVLGHQTMSITVMRAVTSVPMHLVFGIYMGYFLSISIFAKSKRKKRKYRILAILVPILIHISFNCLLILNAYIISSDYNIMLVLFILIYLIVFYVLAIERVIAMKKVNECFMKNKIYKEKYDTMTISEYKKLKNR